MRNKEQKVAKEFGAGCALILIIFISLIAFNFLLTAGLYALVAWCFGLVFSWKIALGIWIVASIICTVTGCCVSID